MFLNVINRNNVTVPVYENIGALLQIKTGVQVNLPAPVKIAPMDFFKPFMNYSIKSFNILLRFARKKLVHLAAISLELFNYVPIQHNTKRLGCPYEFQCQATSS